MLNSDYNREEKYKQTNRGQRKQQQQQKKQKKKMKHFRPKLLPCLAEQS